MDRLEFAAVPSCALECFYSCRLIATHSPLIPGPTLTLQLHLPLSLSLSLAPPSLPLPQHAIMTFLLPWTQPAAFARPHKTHTQSTHVTHSTTAGTHHDTSGSNSSQQNWHGVTCTDVREREHKHKHLGCQACRPNKKQSACPHMACTCIPRRSHATCTHTVAKAKQNRNQLTSSTPQSACAPCGRVLPAGSPAATSAPMSQNGMSLPAGRAQGATMHHQSRMLFTWHQWIHGPCYHAAARRGCACGVPCASCSAHVMHRFISACKLMYRTSTDTVVCMLPMVPLFSSCAPPPHAPG